MARYTQSEIIWVLQALLEHKSYEQISAGFHENFGRYLTFNQLKYLRVKYGDDPRFK